MDNPQFKKEILSLKLQLKENHLLSLQMLLNTYQLINGLPSNSLRHNTSSGSISRLEQISVILKKIKQTKDAIAELEKELFSIEVILSQKK